MNIKRLKILIFDKEQWGYTVSLYQCCKYFKDDFNIIYYCMDLNRPKLKNDGIKVVYISNSGNLILKNIKYIMSSVFSIYKNKPDICLVKYFPGCFLLRLFSFKYKSILIIRTGSIKKNKFLRFLYNRLIKFDSLFFKHIAIISESLAQNLKIYNYYLFPTGAEIISTTNKSFDKLYLLYVGTFLNRNIDKTILGFAKFYEKFSKVIPMKYTLIGSGPPKSIKKMKKIVRNLGLDNVVRILNYVPYYKLKDFFDSHTIGVCFVPITPYFNVQPSNKIFDYLLSGMPVIATNTLENAKIINETNGVLINDTIEDFYKGLIKVYKKLPFYNSENIRSTVMRYKWDLICKEFKNYIIKILQNVK